VRIDECTIERQCEDAFIDLIALRVPEYDAICSFGCGAGVQFLAERFASTPVYPGLNTQFIGVLQSQGTWTEKCGACGSCRLAEYAGICPLTRCSKRMLNGPCGGSQDGRCEISPEVACAWQLIYERSLALGTLDRSKQSRRRRTGRRRSTAGPGSWCGRISTSPTLDPGPEGLVPQALWGSQVVRGCSRRPFRRRVLRRSREGTRVWSPELTHAGDGAGLGVGSRNSRRLFTPPRGDSS